MVAFSSSARLEKGATISTQGTATREKRIPNLRTVLELCATVFTPAVMRPNSGADVLSIPSDARTY
jgi:hypothetical protein